LAMTAGIATLDVLVQPGVFEALVAATSRLAAGMAGAAREAGVHTQHTQAGTMFCTFFTDGLVRDWATVKRSDTARYARFFRALLAEGVYLAPSQFEAGFMSTAHDDAIIDATVAAARIAFQAAQE